MYLPVILIFVSHTQSVPTFASSSRKLVSSLSNAIDVVASMMEKSDDDEFNLMDADEQVISPKVFVEETRRPGFAFGENVLEDQESVFDVNTPTNEEAPVNIEDRLVDTRHNTIASSEATVNTIREEEFVNGAAIVKNEPKEETPVNVKPIKPSTERSVASNSSTTEVAALVDALNDDSFCWRKSVSRGLGAFPSKCRLGFEKNGALCYPVCRDGYHGVGIYD